MHDGDTHGYDKDQPGPSIATTWWPTRSARQRRLLERGVRFVQVWSGNDTGFPRRNWDSHEDVERDHGPLATGMARGAAALIKDRDHPTTVHGHVIEGILT